MENKVSIIICHHTGKLVDKCLDSLKNAEAEKILATSDTDLFSFQKWLKPNGQVKLLTFIPELNQPTLKRNFGASFAKGDYLVFMDDDVVAGKRCIERMASYLDDHPDTGMVYAMLYKMDDHKKIDTSGSFLSWCGFLYETYQERITAVPVLSGKSACCMIRKDLFNKIGRFDEEFVMYGEETDLSWRVWLAGYKIMVLPSAIGYHAFDTALKPREYYNQDYIFYHGCKNYPMMLIKNLPTNKLYIAAINAFLWGIMGCCLLFKNKRGAGLIFKGISYNIRNFGAIWGKRKRIQAGASHQCHQIYSRNPPLMYYFSRFIDYLKDQLHH